MDILREMEIESWKKELVKAELKLREAEKYKDHAGQEYYSSYKLFATKKLERLERYGK